MEKGYQVIEPVQLDGLYANSKYFDFAVAVFHWTISRLPDEVDLTGAEVEVIKFVHHYPYNGYPTLGVHYPNPDETRDLEKDIQAAISRLLEKTPVEELISFITSGGVDWKQVTAEIMAVRDSYPITLKYLTGLDEVGIRLEVANGKWVIDPYRKPRTGEFHDAIKAWLISVLQKHILPRGLGRVYTGDAIFVLEGSPDRIETRRRPDVSFVRADRVKTSDREGVYFQAPDLAIEIISPSESAEDMQHKLNDYLRAGVTQVWQIFPRTQQVIVTEADGSAKTYSTDDTISSGELLPGLNIAVKEIFTAQG